MFQFTEVVEVVRVVRVQLVREAVLAYEARRMSKAEDVARLLEEYLDGADREHLVAVLLNTKGRVLAIHTVSIGDLNGASAHPREVFKAALLANAHAIVLGHNHPSGDPTPSDLDIAATRRLAEAGKLLGIEVLDHVIVGEPGRFVSLREMGVVV